MRAAWLGLGGGLVLGLLLIPLLDWLSFTPLPPQLLALTEVQRTQDEAADRPAAAAVWTPVRLPDDAPRSDAGRQRAWYRLQFDLPAQQPPLWALLLQRPLAAVRIHVNGQLLADSGVSRSLLPEYQHDLRYNLSPGMLRPGRNELLILSVSQSRAAGLGRIWLGDSAQLAAYKAQRNRIEKHWPGFALQVISVLALMLLAFQWIRPRDTAFGWFAAALACWALHTALIQRNAALWGMVGLHHALVAVGLAGFAVFGLLFVQRLLRHRHLRRERLALSFLGLSLLATLPAALVADWPLRALVLWLVVPGVLLVGGLILHSLWQAARQAGAAMPDAAAAPARQAHMEACWLLALTALLLVIGLRDWLLDLGLIGNWQSSRYLPFAAPMVFVVFGGMLLRRHALALRAVEQANTALEQKVAEKTRAIAANWQRIAEIERERARFEERDRLMRDMHDGVGGHLVQALALAETFADERLSDAVRAALDDLRLLIDASDIHSEGLTDILARLRERLRRRLSGLGIELQWDFTRCPTLPRLSPERSIQILRLLQEAVTNTIKHAQARRVSVASERLDDPVSGRPLRLLFEVADDGRGFDLSQVDQGRGLRNMAERVAQLDGQWHLQSQPGRGTRLRFDVPVGDGAADCGPVAVPGDSPH